MRSIGRNAVTRWVVIYNLSCIKYSVRHLCADEIVYEYISLNSILSSHHLNYFGWRRPLAPNVNYFLSVSMLLKQKVPNDTQPIPRPHKYTFSSFLPKFHGR